jgi:hypothetical protein
MYYTDVVFWLLGKSHSLNEFGIIKNNIKELYGIGNNKQ